MMKNILYYSILCFVLMIVVSCEDEDVQRIPDNLGLGPNVRVLIDQENSFFDFEDIENARFAYQVFSESTNLERVIFSVTFTPLSTGVTSDPIVIEEWTQADFTGTPIAVEYTADEMALLFDLSGAADLQGGDVFTFSNSTTLTNGITYPSETVGGNSNVTPNIVNAAATTSFTATFGTFVGCPSQIPTGNFTMIFNGSFCNPPCGFENAGTSPATDLMYEDVTITRTGPVTYLVSQVDQPVEAIYSGVGYTGFSNSGTIQDICGTLQGTFNTQFTSTAFRPIIQPESVFDNDEGTVTIVFETGNGGSGTYDFIPKN